LGEPPFGTVTKGALDRRSWPDLRSDVDRLSPTNLFCSSVRVSTPLRRSLRERRSKFDRLFSIAMSQLHIMEDARAESRLF
jgi:hypothetical protein